MAARIPMRRLLVIPGVLAFTIAAVSGCAGTNDLSNSDSGRIGLLLFHEITNIGSSESVPRSRVAAVPYATLGVRLGSSDESLFVLAGKSGTDLVWLGGRQLAITTRDGRIVRTAGFVQNLSGFQIGGEPSAEENPGAERFLYDYAARSRYGVPVACTVRDAGSERIIVIGVPHDTRHLVESCSADEIDWHFRNQFWKDANGMVWKSEQNVAPDLDAFTLEILRPAQ
ncbi:MAG: YjbF family lipoprotein [Rhizomicrobium sp.]